MFLYNLKGKGVYIMCHYIFKVYARIVDPSGFELCQCTYMLIFFFFFTAQYFKCVFLNVLFMLTARLPINNRPLIKIWGVKSCMWVFRRLQLHPRSAPLIPVLFKVRWIHYLWKGREKTGHEAWKVLLMLFTFYYLWILYCVLCVSVTCFK